MNGKRPYKLPEPLLCSADKEINMTLVDEYIRKHEKRMPRYNYLENLYKGFHDVFHLPEKESWKQDNRLAVNFPRYITETFLGYAYGIPVKKSHPDTKIKDVIIEFDRDNDISDQEYELAKKCCIYGHAFEYFYQDEEAKTKTVICNPKELFVVYDDTVKNRALFAIRYGYKDDKVTRHGEILTREKIIPFEGEIMQESIPNPYGRINCVEYMLNDERIGLYEEVSGMVETYNRVIGEKANDVDSFAEAYLAVLGAELDEDGVYKIRDNRIINLYGTESAKDIIVQFLGKPTADGTQENLLNRLEDLIYQTSMVANISDDSFGNASGTSLAYKLQSMSNLALTFDRKIEKSMRKRYKLFCSLATNVSDQDAWKDIDFTMSRNIPKNLLEEAQTAQALEDVVSKETQLSVLSIVKDVSEEMDRMEKDEKKRQKTIVEKRMFGGAADEQQDVLEE